MSKEIHTLVPSIHTGRYALSHPTTGGDITSGQALEIFLGGRWIAGTIEYARQASNRLTIGTAVSPSGPCSSYYFVTDDDFICGLAVGMKVRTH